MPESPAPHMRICILFLIAFVVVFGFASFDGYYFYDDITYARYAFKLTQGQLILNEETFSHRLGLIVPTAVAYLAAGVNDFTTLWFPMGCTIGTLVAMAFMLYTRQPRLALWAVGLCTLDFYTIFFSNKLYPDVALTLAALLAVLSLYKRNHAWRWSLLFSFANLWGFVCKETIVYLLPFYLLVALSDLKQRQNGTFWMRAFGIGIPLLIAYFGFYFVVKGNPLYRFQIIQEGHYVASYNYFHKPAAALIPRLTYEPLLMLIHSGMFIAVLPAVFALFRKRFWHFFQWDEALFWSRLAFGGLAMFWFFTTSFAYYNPNALFPRMILFLIPFFSIASAHVLQHLTARKTFILALAFAAAALVSLQTGVRGMAIQYGVYAAGWLVTGLGLRYGKDTIFVRQQLFVPLLISLLLIHPVFTMSKPSESGYVEEKRLIEKYLVPMNQPVYVFTDNKLKNGFDYYYQFAPPASTHFLEFTDLPSFDKQAGSKIKRWVLINAHSIDYLETAGIATPAFVRTIPNNWQLLAREGRVTLYEVAAEK